jgi:simple sugar transport system permease protein
LLSGAPPVARAGLLVASALAGALWVLPAAYLEARRGVPEVLSTILLNLIAAAAVSGLVRGALQDPTGDYPQSRALPDAVRLAPLVPGSRATAAIVAALVLAFFVTLVVEATPLGLKLRAIGLAPAAARAIGLPGARLRLLAFSASGALAGLAGGLEVLAVTGRLYDPFSAGAGYTGIAAALLGGSHPLAAAASAMLFAALGAGSSAMQRDTGVPGALATIVPGVLVLTVLAARARLTQKRA